MTPIYKQDLRLTEVSVLLKRHQNYFTLLMKVTLYKKMNSVSLEFLRKCRQSLYKVG